MRNRRTGDSTGSPRHQDAPADLFGSDVEATDVQGVARQGEDAGRLVAEDPGDHQRSARQERLDLLEPERLGIAQSGQIG